MPTYIIARYKLPKKLCSEMNSEMAMFLYGQELDEDHHG